MSKRIETIVKPRVLIWARESSGLEPSLAAKRLHVSEERLAEWEGGAGSPSLAQLRKISQVYKRPLALFFLPEPPAEQQPVHDFRRLPGEVAGRRSPELLVELRKTFARREAAIELYRDLGLTPRRLPFSLFLSDDPEEAGERLRDLLGITFEMQFRWKTPHEALSGWRTAIEAWDVMVFQASRVDISEMRGFSISGTELPVVVINAADAANSRIFSMLHEFSHILLRDGGLCDFVEEADRPSEEQAAEVFCNHVAGAALVPMARLVAEPGIQGRATPAAVEDNLITELAKRYNVSREVILRRLLIGRVITRAYYQEKRAAYQRDYEQIAAKARGGGPAPHIVALSRMGNAFSRLVLNAYYQEKITSSDLATYLEVKLNHVPKIEQNLFGRSTLQGLGL